MGTPKKTETSDGERARLSESMQLAFTPLPIQVACPVPVTPDGRVVGDDGEPLPMEKRTEYCAVYAHWMIGGQVSCDVHTALACEITGIDFDGLVEEAGRSVAAARRPWAERERCPQEDAQRTREIHGAAG
jgi:hypothetical protein